MPRKKQDRNVERARQLRKQMSLPEVLLWNLLRHMDDPRFRRQHPLGRFVIDFYCAQAKVGIEVDGAAHDMGDRGRLDAERDAWLHEQGIEVVRIAATDVLASPEQVVDGIVRYCRSK
jgi:very-short-patch-repair endonuclease